MEMLQSIATTRISRQTTCLYGNEAKILVIDEMDCYGNVVHSQQYLEREDGTIDMSITVCNSDKPITTRPDDRQTNGLPRIANCRNCGAPVNGHKCDYCGTRYSLC